MLVPFGTAFKILKPAQHSSVLVDHSFWRQGGLVIQSSHAYGCSRISDSELICLLSYDPVVDGTRAESSARMVTAMPGTIGGPGMTD